MSSLTSLLCDWFLLFTSMETCFVALLLLSRRVSFGYFTVCYSWDNIYVLGKKEIKLSFIFMDLEKKENSVWKVMRWAICWDLVIKLISGVKNYSPCWTSFSLWLHTIVKRIFLLFSFSSFLSLPSLSLTIESEIRKWRKTLVKKKKFVNLWQKNKKRK